MKHIESTVKVYVTNRYEDFKKLDGNRELSINKIKKIKKAITEDGINVLKYAPVMVDIEMHILDGQHRFEVAKELEEQVHYVIVPDMGIQEVARVNSNSTNWAIKDYLKSYVEMEKPAYLRIKDEMSKFDINPVVLAGLFHTGNTSTNVREQFINGEIKIYHPDTAMNILNHLKDLRHYTDKPYSRRMGRAMEILIKSDKYNHEFMLDKFEQSKMRIDRIDSHKTIIAQMEEIANFRMRETVRLT